jgi:hypothetical protein
MLLQAQKELIVADIHDLKNELRPTIDAISFLGKIATRDKSDILISGVTNQLIDLVFKKLILARTGWLTRLIVPFFIKNYSSHFIGDHKKEWVKKLFSWIGHKNSNGQATSHSSKEQ